MGGALPTFSHSEILKAERKALVQRVEHLQQYQTAARMFKARRPRPPRSGPFFCCLIIFGDEVVESFRDLLGFGRKFSKRFHLFDNAINRIIGNAIAGCFHSADFWRRMIAETAMMLASFHFVGAEIVLILAVGLTLFGARNLPELARGLGQGMIEFRRATKRLTDATDK